MKLHWKRYVVSPTLTMHTMPNLFTLNEYITRSNGIDTFHIEVFVQK